MIKWKDKASWTESLFYAICILMGVLFAIQKQIAAVIWVWIAAQNFYRANKSHRAHMADMEKCLKDLRRVTELIERSRK